MKKLISVVFFLLPIVVFGQIKFNKSYEFGFYNASLGAGGNVIPDLFGGYFCQFTADDMLYSYSLVVNYDSLGNILDTIHLHSMNENLLSPIAGQLHFDNMDSTYFGVCNSFHQDTTSLSGVQFEPILVKRNLIGDTLWTRRINNNKQSVILNSIYPLSDGFLCTGIYSPDSLWGVNYSYLVKVDSNGLFLWDEIYGDSLANEFATNIVKLQNGNLGLSTIRIFSNGDSVAPKVYNLGISGNILATFQWADSGYTFLGMHNSFGLLKRDIPSSVRPDCYIGYFLLDSTKSTPTGPVDFIYVRLRGLDSNFNTVWSRSIKRNDYYVLEHISLLNNGDMMITGSIENPVTNNIEGWVVVMDSYGIIKWERRYNKFNNTKHCLIHGKQTSDGGYILMGYTDSMDLINNAKPWLIKVDSLGCEDWSAPGCSPVNVTNYSNHEDVISVYPNPTSGVLHIEFTPNLIGAKMKFELRDLVGKVVFQQVLSTSSSKCITALPFTLPNGNYIAHFIAENGFFYSTKLRIQQ
jgi:hypothetical protein